MERMGAIFILYHTLLTAEYIQKLQILTLNTGDVDKCRYLLSTVFNNT